MARHLRGCLDILLTDIPAYGHLLLSKFQSSKKYCKACILSPGCYGDNYTFCLLSVIVSVSGLAKKVAGYQGRKLQKVVGPDEKLGPKKWTLRILSKQAMVWESHQRSDTAVAEWLGHGTP